MAIFLGHTRFNIDSYGSKWFNSTRTRPSGLSLFADRADYLEWLYDEERLNRRLEILCGWTLPQLELAVSDAEESGHSVRHYISFSENLPKQYQERLREAAAAYDFLSLHTATGEVDAFAPPEVSTQMALDQLYPRTTKDPDQVELFATYRLDDDDVLSIDYFSLLAPYVTEQNLGYRVSLGLGFSAIWRQGELFFARETYYPKVSMGMASICLRTQGGVLVYPERFIDRSHDNHDFADRGSPVITDCRQHAFFRILHETQSGVLHRTRGLGRHWYLDAMSRIVHAAPADLDAIRSKFPVLAEHAWDTQGKAEDALEVLGEKAQLTPGAQTFKVLRTGSFILEVVFSSAEEALNHDVAVKWVIEGIDGFEAHSSEGVGHITASSVRYHKIHGYSTWVSTHGQFGRHRYAMVDLHPKTNLTSMTVLSRSGKPVTLERLRLISIE